MKVTVFVPFVVWLVVIEYHCPVLHVLRLAILLTARVTAHSARALSWISGCGALDRRSAVTLPWISVSRIATVTRTKVRLFAQLSIFLWLHGGGRLIDWGFHWRGVSDLRSWRKQSKIRWLR